MTDWRHEGVSSLESLYIDASLSRRIRALAHARLCVEERPRRKRRGLSTFVIAVVAHSAPRFDYRRAFQSRDAREMKMMK